MPLRTSLDPHATCARPRAGARTGAFVTALAAVLAGCGGATIDQAGSPGGSSSPSSATGSATACGTVDLAISPWVGYEANAAVFDAVAEDQLGCTVVHKDLKEEIAWQGFGTGEVDVVLENWGHEDLKAKHVQGDKTAVEAGSTGVKGSIGWFVPPWLAEEHPDITDWKNLNKYAAMFRTSESGGKGQLLDGDPSYVSYDPALVKNLGLDYKVVYGASEAALITSLRSAERSKKPLLAYFYSPQWFLNEVPLVRVDLPTYTPGCAADLQKIACDYPQYDLDKVMSAEFAASGSPAVDLVKNFHWSNADQNEVARDIAEKGMKPAAAGKKWVAAHPAQVAAWLGR